MLNGPIGDLSDGERKKEKKSKTAVSGIKAIGCPIKLILSDLQVEVEPSQMSI
jgi:hypothetical protein